MIRGVWRWAVVVVVTAVLASLPWTISHLPAGRASLSAGALYDRIRGSGGVAYHGYAESAGGLVLPDADQINSVADLVGGRTQLRVWWSAADRWRVDSISPTGEQDLHLDGTFLWQWDYERNRADATIVRPGQVHLPRATDLLPPELGRRLLAAAKPGELSIIGSRRIAGHDGVGLRMRPDEETSTIDKVDVWADQRTGLPLQVIVTAKGDQPNPIITKFLDLSISAPDGADTQQWRPPAGAKIVYNRFSDLLAAFDNRFSREAPTTLAGLPEVQRLGQYSSVTLYGGSVTTVALVPMPGNIARSLLDQLSKATAVPIDRSRDRPTITVTVGPVTLAVVAGEDRTGWLIAGTVTVDAIDIAIGQLGPLS